MWQKLGQHFLIDQDILQQMQRSLADIKKEYGLKYCLEVGPGEGALTKRLKSVFETSSIIVFEADRTLEKKIGKFFPLEQVVRWDILQQEITVNTAQKVVVNWAQKWFLANMTLIAWNLPYYITSPILRKFFEVWHFSVWRFLIQKEVADKIDTHSKKKSFLRRIINYAYEVKTLIYVPPESFAPPPRVDSAVISVIKTTTKHNFSLQELIEIIDCMSQYSRKTIGKVSKIVAKRGKYLSIPESLQSKRLEELKREEISKIIILNRE